MISYEIQQKVAPIQAFQVDQIIKRIKLFDTRSRIYHVHFHNLPVCFVVKMNIQ